MRKEWVEDEHVDIIMKFVYEINHLTYNVKNEKES